jgi:hypothetical protein
MGLILLVILLLLLIGSLPTWPYSSRGGYYPSGGLGFVLAMISDPRAAWPSLSGVSAVETRRMAFKAMQVRLHAHCSRRAPGVLTRSGRKPTPASLAGMRRSSGHRLNKFSSQGSESCL